MIDVARLHRTAANSVIMRTTVVALSLLSLLASVAAQTATKAETESVSGSPHRPFMVDATLSVPRVFVDYCSKAYPPLQGDFESEYTVFKSKFLAAIEPYLARLDALPGPIPEREAKELPTVGQAILKTVVNLEPAPYCTSALARMRAESVDSLRAGFKPAFEVYEATVLRQAQAAAH